jgi:hypothetical protein
VITDFSYTYKSPILAGVLSIVPGLGQVYNEDYLLGGACFVVDVSLYLAAAAYAGLLDPTREDKLIDASILLLAIAGGIHLLSIFDATLEAVRRNENLDKWGFMISPNDNGFRVAYQFRF